MPIISIIEQPATNALKAAYRPIVFVVRASRTDGNAKPPIVYCDIYVDGIYYKSQERTQYQTLNSTNSDWQFDIMDAVQEILSATIQQNGGTSIVIDSLAMRSIYCKFRSSGYDANSFITAEGTAPIQGTGTVAPVSGTGTQSSSFYAVMSTLQHDQNQDAATHLSFYKTGTWDANVYPLSHRKAGYKVCNGDSDYFPIANLSSMDPLCLKLFYKNKGDLAYSSISKCGESSCTGVSYSAFSFADAIPGTSYSRSIPLSGTGPFTLSYSSLPSWMTANISGSTLTFSGTAGSGDVGTNIPVNFIVTNACGSASGYKTINVVSDCVGVSISGTASDAQEGTAYLIIFTLSGTGPFALSAGPTLPSWMSISLSDNQVSISGTPTSGDVGSSNPIAFSVTNACGSQDFTANISVIATGVRFGTTTFRGGDALTDHETANILGGQPGATLTIVCTDYRNPNGGTLKINGSTVSSVDYSFNILLDSSGNGSFDADIYGANHPGTAILGEFTINGTTNGTIGSPPSYIISKTF